MDQVTVQTITPYLEDLRALFGVAKGLSWGSMLGILGSAAVLITRAVDLWRSDRWQSVLLAGSARFVWLRFAVWGLWPDWAKVAMPIALAVLAAAAGVAAGKMTVGMAVVAALAAWLGSLGTHHAVAKPLSGALSETMGALKEAGGASRVANAMMSVVVRYDPRKDPNSPQYVAP